MHCLSKSPCEDVWIPAGVTTPGGATHQAIEDTSIMRSLPNMTILECGDATDVESVLDAANAINGPVYIRMLRERYRGSLINQSQ